MLISEYCITPDVFDISCYADKKICGLYLEQLLSFILEEAIVCDLCTGKWSSWIKKSPHSHPHTKFKILATFKKEGRIHFAQNFCSGNVNQYEYENWLDVAIKYYKRNPSTKIITSTHQISKLPKSVHKDFKPIEKIASFPRHSSIRLERKTAAYLTILKPIFKYSNSLMFIDPYLHLGHKDYREFIQLLEAIVKDRDEKIQSLQPKIEIHTSCQNANPEDMKASFIKKTKHLGLKITVYIWDDFHDRFLISNLIGINLNQGFSIGNPKDKEKTTWQRLSRTDKEDIEREFHPDSSPHKLIDQFIIN